MKISLPEFPNSEHEKFTIIECDDPLLFNCIAWAAGDNKKWWWPSVFAYWPQGCTRTLSILAFTEMFSSLGYECCENGNHEIGYTKIAIFANENLEPTHAARQDELGNWTSKLGSEFLVQHTLQSISGGIYGNIAQYMKKPLKLNFT